MTRQRAEELLDAPGDVVPPPEEAGQGGAAQEGAGAFDPSPAPPPHKGDRGGSGEGGQGPEPPDFERCPIICLGHLDGRYFFTDRGGQFRAMRAGGLNAAGLSDLFGGETGWLVRYFPGTGQNKGWFDYRKAAAALIERCWAMGFFNPEGAIRGRGLWPVKKTPGGDEAIILHLGESVYRIELAKGFAQAGRPPVGGRVGGFVYSTRDAWPAPAEDPLTADEGAELAAFIQERWNWHSDGVPAGKLYAGWAFIAQAPGLLLRRPPLWLLGDAGTGKSTLMKLIRSLQAERAVYLENLTESSLREHLVRDEARAVLIDEAEAPEEVGGRGGSKAARMGDLIDAIRYAFDAEQGGWARGGQNAATGKMEAIFCCGAINMPPVSNADLTRMVQLRLGPMPKSEGAEDDAAFKRDLARFSTWGPRLLRRVVDEWGRFQEAFEGYWALLRADGHTPRGADALATVMTGYELLVDAGPAAEALRRERVAEIDASAAAIETEGLSNAELCWLTLTSSRTTDWNGGVQDTIGGLMSKALDENRQDDPARAELRRMGVLITDETGKVATGEHKIFERYIAIADRHTELDGVFRRAGRTAWMGGGHARALKGLPLEVEGFDPVRRSTNKIRFANTPPQRATLIHSDAITCAERDEGDEPREDLETDR